MEAAEPIRVMVVDRHQLIRAGIAQVIGMESGVVTVAAFGEMAEAVSALATIPVSVVVIDYESESAHRIGEMISLARENNYGGGFLVMTAELKDHRALDLLKHGVAGIVSKSDPPEVLISAIRRVNDGGWWVTDEHIRLMIESMSANNQAEYRSLSVRERTVLRAVLEGQSNRMIAADVGVTESAIKSTLQHLFRKTGTRNRGQLIRAALERFPGEIRE